MFGFFKGERHADIDTEAGPDGGDQPQHGIEIQDFDYIVVKDARPLADGTYNECPDVSVVSVPLVALENQFGLIREKLRQYRECKEDDRWPGIGNYNLPIYDMPEVTLVD